MKIMTFNVRIDVEIDGVNNWKHRYHSIANYIHHESPHIIGMQEANIPMLDNLKNLLEEYVVIGNPRNPGGETTAIWVRKDVSFSHEQTFFLTSSPWVNSVIEGSAFPRIATSLLIHDEEGELLIINTHLDYLSEEVQKKQMTHLLNTIEIPSRAILMGDFNQTIDGGVRILLEEAGFLCTYEGSELKKASFHAFTGVSIGQPIDFIYVKGFTQIPHAKIDQQSHKERMLSDHFPVLLNY